MTYETVFNLGDEAWALDGTTALKGKVSNIHIILTKPDTLCKEVITIDSTGDVPYYAKGLYAPKVAFKSENAMIEELKSRIKNA